MNIYLLNINNLTDEMINEVKMILPSRFDYACKYKVREDFLRSIAGSYLLIKYINLVNDRSIHYSKSGKPYLINGPYFNIAHSKGYAAMVFDNKEIGIDIEFIDSARNLKSIPYVIDEFKYSQPTQNDMFMMWCMKESYVKMNGDGLSKLSDVNLSDFDNSCFNKTLIYKNYVISITSLNKISEVKIIEI